MQQLCCATNNDTIRFKLDTQEIVYTIDMFRDTLKMPVETPDNPFVAPVNIEIIESFMHTVAIKNVIQYPRFPKLIIADFIKKYSSISPRLEKDYHSIKEDIPLVSVYTMRNVTIRGMLIPNAFLTKKICATDDYKEKKKQSTTPIPPPSDDRERDEITEATLLSLTLQKTALVLEAQENVTKVQKKLEEDEIEKIVEGEEDAESYVSEFVDSMFNDDDDFGTKIELESHKGSPEVVVDYEVNEKEKQDERKMMMMRKQMLRLRKKTMMITLIIRWSKLMQRVVWRLGISRGKLKPKADIGVFVGYAPAKKAYQIYNRQTRLIMETIYVEFDEMTTMAFKQLGSGPELQLMTLGTISLGLVQNPPSSTPSVPPTKNNWDILFQPMFDEYFNPPSSVFFSTLLAPVEPKNYKEASLDSSWIEAMQEEIYEFKRLEESFIPVAIIEDIRIFVANATNKNMTIYKMDVKTAFLYGKLREEASRAWYDMLSKFLLSQEFSKGVVDPTLFTRKECKDILLKSGMETSDSVGTLMVDKTKLDRDQHGKPIDPTHYRVMDVSLPEWNPEYGSLKLEEEEIEKMVEGEEDAKSYASDFADSMFNDDDFGTKIEPESHKESPKVVFDDKVNEKEKQDEKKDDDAKKTNAVIEEKNNDDHIDNTLVGTHATDTMETRNEQMQTLIPTPTRSPRKDLSSDNTISKELTANVSPTTTTTSKDSSKSKSKR
nr:retrovirus-related Pol polyprotein from transposon TNT 1-94 [Tanacetum cinerariifolium]